MRFFPALLALGLAAIGSTSAAFVAKPVATGATGHDTRAAVLPARETDLAGNYAGLRRIELEASCLPDLAEGHPNPEGRAEELAPHVTGRAKGVVCWEFG